jgi:hypothetical protein
MKLIITESQLKRVISEIINPKTIKQINWYFLANNGRQVWKDSIRSQVKIEQEYYDYLGDVLSALSSIRKEVESDVMKGSLSQSTLDKLNQNLMSVIITTSKDKMLIDSLNKIPESQRKIARSIVGRGIIKSSIDKAVKITGQSYYINGMVTALKTTYNPSSPIVQNYIKVLTQIGTSLSQNEMLKKNIYNTIIRIV